MQSELQLARTGLQECDDSVKPSLYVWLILLADQRIVQHSAAVLSSSIKSE